MFYFYHENPSFHHEQIALEEYTVPADYGCVNIWTAKMLLNRKNDRLYLPTDY